MLGPRATDSNNHRTSFVITDPTASRSITFPDTTGTVLLSSTTNTISTLANDVAISTSGDITTSGSFTANGNSILGNEPGDTVSVGGRILGGTPLKFTGATNANSHVMNFAITDPTATRTVTFPDTTGTVLLLTITL